MKKPSNKTRKEKIESSLRALTECVQRICGLSIDHNIIVEKPVIKIFTPDDVAVRIGVSKKTLANWRAQGLGPSSVKIGGRVAYKATDLEAWIADRPVAAAIQRRRAS